MGWVMSGEGNTEAPVQPDGTVNDQITDAVTQSDGAAYAGAVSMGTLYQAEAHSMGVLFENTVATQAQAVLTANSAAVQGLQAVYALNSLTGAVVVSKMLGTDAGDTLAALKGLPGVPVRRKKKA